MTFVGSGDAFGSGGRLQACVLVDDGQSRTLLDCGATSLTGMKWLGIDPSSIDTVTLSHLHGDHFAGIPFLVLDGQFSRRERDLRVIGPVGTQERLRTAMEALYPGSSGVKRRFELNVMEVAPGESTEFGTQRLTAFAAEHASGAQSLALRLEIAAKVVAYSGDTAWTPELVEVSRGADLFICESYFRDRRVPYHLSFAELLEHRAEFDCRRIILTHMTFEMIEADQIEYERASDGMTIEI